MGSLNTVLSDLWSLFSICRYHEKKIKSDRVQIWDFLNCLVHFCTKKKNKIISLGMWTEHNTMCLLVILLNEFITYIYLYTHLYTCVCICIYVLKFCLLYLITELGFLIQWCLLAGKNWSEMNIFCLKVCMYLYLSGFPVDDLKYLPCQPMQPVIL